MSGLCCWYWASGPAQGHLLLHRRQVPLTASWTPPKLPSWPQTPLRVTWSVCCIGPLVRRVLVTLCVTHKAGLPTGAHTSICLPAAHSNHSELQQHAAAVQDAGTLLEKQHKVKQVRERELLPAASCLCMNAQRRPLAGRDGCTSLPAGGTTTWQAACQQQWCDMQALPGCLCSARAASILLACSEEPPAVPVPASENFNGQQCSSQMGGLTCLPKAMPGW